MHLLPGRLRIVAKSMKGDEGIESIVHAALRRLKGVRSIRTSVITGAITVRFDAEQISPYRILNKLIQLELIPNVVPFPNKAVRAPASGTLGPAADRKKLLFTLAGTAVKLALPFLLERYLGRPAARALRRIV